MAEQENPGTPGVEPEKNPQLEAALANKLLGRGESMNDELISSADTPQELFRGLRAIEAKLENGNIPSSLSENYRPPAQLSVLYNRAENLKIPNSELMKRGWLVGYNESTGEGLPAKRKFSSAALGVDEQFIIKDGQFVPDIFGQPSTRVVFNYGTEKERAELAHSYDRAVLELEARAILGEHIGVRLHLNLRDNLEGLVDWQHGTTAKFKADHLHALFNMPDVEELAVNPENRTLGDQVEEAIFLNLVMLNSGTKQKMQDFLERPGSKHLIAKMAKEWDVTYDQWVYENIGDVNGWVDDTKRLLSDDKDANGNNLPATFKVEAGDKRRGALTKWGNIAAFSGNPGDFGGDDEKSFIENDIGGLVGSVEASWVAATMMRAIGAYASDGYVALPSGKSSLPLGEGRYISSDDTGKFMAYLLNIKEGLKGRKSGLKDMIGRIPDMAMNLFDWAQVKVSLADGTTTRRSIWDAWLGTSGGKSKIDLLTGEKTTNLTTREEYHRLGDLNFESLDRDFHGTFGIMQWLAGRAKDGVLPNALSTDIKFDNFSLEEMKGIWKYIGIVFNPVILTKGSTQLYEIQKNIIDVEADKIIKPGSVLQIQKNFFSNLMTARMRSASFKTNVLPQEVTVYDENKGTNYSKKVSAAALACLFVKSIEDDDPRSEEEIIKNYMDDNVKIRTVGGLFEAINAVNAREIINDNLGRIVGKRVAGKDKIRELAFA